MNPFDTRCRQTLSVEGQDYSYYKLPDLKDERYGKEIRLEWRLQILKIAIFSNNQVML